MNILKRVKYNFITAMLLRTASLAVMGAFLFNGTVSAVDSLRPLAEGEREGIEGFDELRQLIEESLADCPERPVIVALDGKAMAGKTTFAHEVDPLRSIDRPYYPSSIRNFGLHGLGRNIVIVEEKYVEDIPEMVLRGEVGNLDLYARPGSWMIYRIIVEDEEWIRENRVALRTKYLGRYMQRLLEEMGEESLKYRVALYEGIGSHEHLGELIDSGQLGEVTLILTTMLKSEAPGSMRKIVSILAPLPILEMYLPIAAQMKYRGVLEEQI